MDINPTLDDLFFRYVQINLINPLYMFIISNKTLKYKITRYTFTMRYKSHDADLRTVG
jgi:hypothetical protein